MRRICVRSFPGPPKDPLVGRDSVEPGKMMLPKRRAPSSATSPPITCSIEHVQFGHNFALCGGKPIRQETRDELDRRPATGDGSFRIIAILHKWGVHTLGDLAALPQDDLAARLGPEAARLREQASGKSTRLLRLVRPAEIFAEQIDFEHEIETVAPLLLSCNDFSSNSPGDSARFTSSPRSWSFASLLPIRQRTNSRRRIKRATNTAFKFPIRPTRSSCCFASSRPIWKISAPIIQLWPWRWKRSRPGRGDNSSIFSRPRCATRPGSRKRSPGSLDC